ncbi:MAG: hypothetical protein JST26_13575 [Bacteroidetes bacterium]|nr:hypothetical protein [Bacteroidota bacterium]
MMTNILKIIKTYKLYVAFLVMVVSWSVYNRITENRIVSWFSDETEKPSGPGQHGYSGSHHK